MDGGDGDDDFPLLSGSDEDEPVRNPDEDAEAQGEAEDGEAEGEAAAEVEAEEDEDQQQQVEVEKPRQQPIVDTDRIQEAMGRFTADQLDRYEHYRRSGFPKTQMRRLVQNVAGCSISVPMSIVMSGLAKMFVGDVIETARIIMSEQQEEGPIRPRHLRQAYRRLKLEGKLPIRSRPSLFR
ncbi:transcription initiation factor TFIID subunit 11 [Selaginella moellendorffii]|nr:transcription initiation factor TFIID subunit 11 [Selaginella moellendorffii]|eukprot:XP_002978451.2 transcription initiation factor TFIID subunit 11 [Selaginella moellendorffii]